VPAKIAAYCRVSSPGQAEKASIQLQKRAITDFLATRTDLKGEVAWYLDEAQSGVSKPLQGRPAGMAMMKAAAAGELAAVVVWRVDRLGRDAPSTLIAQAFIEKACGVPILSVTEGGTVSELVMGLQALLGGHEAEKRSDAQKRGARHLVATGHYVGGVVPFGYQVLPGDNPARRAGKLGPDETPLGPGLASAAEVIREVFRLAAVEGQSSVRIATTLNNRRIPTGYQRLGRDFKIGTRKERVSGRWTSGSVRRMLRSRVYAGEVAWGRRNTKPTAPGFEALAATLGIAVPMMPRAATDIVKGAVPALVSEDTWQAAQETLVRHRWAHFRNPKVKHQNGAEQYLLRGLMKCALCGRTYIGSTSEPAKGGKTYRCNGRSKQHNVTGELCPSATIDYDIESQVWADVAAFFQNPNRLEKALLRSVENESVDHKANDKARKGITERLAAMEPKRARLVELYTDGVLEKSELTAKLAAVDAERRTLAEDLGRIEAAATSLAEQKETIHETVARVTKLIARKQVPFEVKRQVIELLVKRAVVYTIPWEAKVKRGERWMTRRKYAEVEIDFAFGLSSPYREEASNVRLGEWEDRPSGPVDPELAALYVASPDDPEEHRRPGLTRFRPDEKRVGKAAKTLSDTRRRTARGSSPQQA
jgi:site-specific DNA recombinase